MKAGRTEEVKRDKNKGRRRQGNCAERKVEGEKLAEKKENKGEKKDR